MLFKMDNELKKKKTTKAATPSVVDGGPPSVVAAAVEKKRKKNPPAEKADISPPAAAAAAAEAADPPAAAAEDAQIIKALRIRSVLREIYKNRSSEDGEDGSNVRINKEVPVEVNRLLQEISQSYIDKLEKTDVGIVMKKHDDTDTAEPSAAAAVAAILPSSTFKKYLKARIKDRFKINRVSGELLSKLQSKIEGELVRILTYSIACMENVPRKTLFVKDIRLAKEKPNV